MFKYIKRVIFTIIICISVWVPSVSTVEASLSTPAEGVTSFNLGTIITGGTASYWQGMKFTVGSKDMVVTELGRLYVTENTRAHTVKLVNAAGADVAGGSVSISMPGTAVGAFKYVTLSSPVTLTAGNTYYLVSFETEGNDYYYNWDTTVTPTSDFTINSGIYQMSSGGGWSVLGSSNNSWGPLNFKYSVEVPDEPVVTPVAAPVISSFSASTNSITSGQSLSLSWNISGATSVSINQGVGAVSSNSITVSPTQSTTYTITASNTGGSTSASVTVSVSQPVVVQPPPSSGSTFDIRNYGAKCNGTDDTAAIQATLNAVTNGATVDIPCIAGVNSTGLVLNNKSNVTIRGINNGGFKALSSGGQSIPWFGPYMLAVKNCAGCIVKDLEFDSQSFDVGAIGITGSAGAIIQNNYSHDVGGGTIGGAISSSINTDLKVIGNRVERTYSKNGFFTRGLWLGNGGGGEETNLTVESNIVKNTAGTAIAFHSNGFSLVKNSVDTAGGSCAKHATGGMLANQLIAENTFKNCEFNAIQIRDQGAYTVANLVIRDNILEGNGNTSSSGGTGISVFVKLKDSQIIRNKILNNNRQNAGGWLGGIYIQGAENVLIEDNDFYDAGTIGSGSRQYMGIHMEPLQASSNLTISKNRFHNNSSSGVIVSTWRSLPGSISGVSFVNNVFTNNSQSAIRIYDLTNSINNVTLSGNCFAGNALNINDNRGTRAVAQAASSLSCAWPLGSTPVVTEPTTPPVVVPPTQSPYFGSVQSIPGTIEAETFDVGAEGVAYHDTDTVNIGGAYRTTAVDLETSTDSGGGYSVGWTIPGEWLEYSVNVTKTALYDVSFRVAANTFYGGGTIHMEVDGVDKTGAVTIAETGSWQSWQTVTKKDVQLSAGTHVVKVAFDSYLSGGNRIGVANLNWIKFTEVSAPVIPPIIPPVIPPIIPTTTPPVVSPIIPPIVSTTTSPVVPPSSGSANPAHSGVPASVPSGTTGSSASGSSSGTGSSASSGSGSSGGGGVLASSGSSSSSSTFSAGGSVISPGLLSGPKITLTRNLWVGTKGDDVLQVQKLLVSEGILTADSMAGYYGLLTEAAIKAFQRKYDIASSGNALTTGYGVIGPKTKQKINELLQRVPSTPTIAPTSTVLSVQLTRNLYRGVKGNDVVSLQNLLIKEGVLSADSNTGYYGLLTEAAVKAFQMKYNIVNSGNALTTGFGVAGPKTRQMINSLLIQ